MNVTMWLNKIRRLNCLTPNYIKITTNIHNKQGHYNMKAAITYRINQELTFLFLKLVQHLPTQHHFTWIVIQYTIAHGTLVTHLNLVQIIYLYFIF